MRALADAQRLRAFMRALGREADGDSRVYLTGGATAVLLGFRASTLDADILMVPESDRLYRALPALKDALRLNIEIAAPLHFIPELPGWQERSLFIAREGRLSFHHFDFYSQALAKAERGHAQDRRDVAAFLEHGLVEPARLRALFEQIVPQLYRFPALDEAAFRANLDAALGGTGRA
jgi:hypothetical protein